MGAWSVSARDSSTTAGLPLCQAAETETEVHVHTAKRPLPPPPHARSPTAHGELGAPAPDPPARLRSAQQRWLLLMTPSSALGSHLASLVWCLLLLLPL